MIKTLIAKKLMLALLLTAAHTSAGFDAWSTRRAMRAPGAREMNPFVRPFAGGGAMYAATQLDVLLPELLMPKLPKKWRWVGYAFIAGAAVEHLGLGMQNLRVSHGAQNLHSSPSQIVGIPAYPPSLGLQPSR